MARDSSAPKVEVKRASWHLCTMEGNFKSHLHLQTQCMNNHNLVLSFKKRSPSPKKQKRIEKRIWLALDKMPSSDIISWTEVSSSWLYVNIMLANVRFKYPKNISFSLINTNASQQHKQQRVLLTGYPQQLTSGSLSEASLFGLYQTCFVKFYRFLQSKQTDTR